MISVVKLNFENFGKYAFLQHLIILPRFVALTQLQATKHGQKILFPPPPYKVSLLETLYMIIGVSSFWRGDTFNFDDILLYKNVDFLKSV